MTHQGRLPLESPKLCFCLFEIPLMSHTKTILELLTTTKFNLTAPPAGLTQLAGVSFVAKKFLSILSGWILCSRNSTTKNLDTRHNSLRNWKGHPQICSEWLIVVVAFILSYRYTFVMVIWKVCKSFLSLYLPIIFQDEKSIPRWIDHSWQWFRRSFIA